METINASSGASFVTQSLVPDRVLTGKYRHWCDDWDGLPIDETTPEWPCVCADALVRHDTKTRTLETE